MHSCIKSHETKLKSKSNQEPEERDMLRLVGFKPF